MTGPASESVRYATATMCRITSKALASAATTFLASSENPAVLSAIFTVTVISFLLAANAPPPGEDVGQHRPARANRATDVRKRVEDCGTITYPRVLREGNRT